MAETTEISWADATFNPWIGCTKVSPACAHCYAEAFSKRTGKGKWGASGTRVKTSYTNWRKPMIWNHRAEYAKTRTRVFCASLADVFEDWQGPIHDHKGEVLRQCHQCGWGKDCEGTPSWPSDWCHCTKRDTTMDDIRALLFDLIDQTPHVVWMLLTKRPENIRRMWPMDHYIHGPNYGNRQNVWLGATVENQEYADQRVPELLACRELASVLFLSCEPLLGAIDFGTMTTDPPNSGLAVTDGFGRFDGEGPSLIDWVISGGESGGKARPSNPDSFRSLRDQCAAAGVAYHHKQHGEWCDRYAVGATGWAKTGERGGRIYGVLDNDDYSQFPVVRVPILGGRKFETRWLDDDKTHEPLMRVGKQQSGRLLDGVEHLAFPKVRESVPPARGEKGEP